MGSPVNPVSNSGAAAGQSNSSSSTSTTPPTEQMFLQLLVAQIQNQDPLNPTDGTQFVSQLAQFSELEQVLGIRSDIEQYMGINQPASTSSTGATSSQNSNTNTPAGTPIF
jgi:flagellar basal-body rod modification protein FlgD